MAERRITSKGEKIIFDKAVSADAKKMALFLETEREEAIDPVYLEGLLSGNPAFHVSGDEGTIAFVYTRGHAPDILEIVDLVVDSAYQEEELAEELISAIEKASLSWQRLIVFSEDSFWSKMGYKSVLDEKGLFYKKL